MKAYFILNICPLYRKGLFQSIDQTFDCSWHFGENKTDIKPLDTSILNDVSIHKTRRILGSNIKWTHGILEIFLKKRGIYIITGDIYSISNWILLLMHFLIFRNRKLYLWTHGWYGKERKIQSLIKSTFFKMSSGLLLYGNHAKKLLLSRGFPKHKLYLIKNSLDYETHTRIRNHLYENDIYINHFHNKYKNIIFIGRLTQTKRIDILINALAHLKKFGENFNVTIIGAGTEDWKIKNLCKHLNISDSVWFYGETYDDYEIAKLIFNADLCVSPGNVGLTAIHCMTFGTPVITHDSFEAQMPEFESVIPGVTGDYFQKDNSLSLTNAIIRWFSNEEYSREKIRNSCYDEIKNNWNPTLQIDLLKTILK